MKIETIGLDIAKQIFQAHGVDRSGEVVLRKRLRRAEVSSFFAGVEPCLIGLEASGGAHYWFRMLSRLGNAMIQKANVVDSCGRSVVYRAPNKIDGRNRWTAEKQRKLGTAKT